MANEVLRREMVLKQVEFPDAFYSCDFCFIEKMARQHLGSGAKGRRDVYGVLELLRKKEIQCKDCRRMQDYLFGGDKERKRFYR